MIWATAFTCCSLRQDDVEINLAPIHEVRVDVVEATDPVEIYVYVKGGLSDSCTTLHSVTTERFEDSINIEVYTEHQQGIACAELYTFFEENVALGHDFISGELYSVDVNGTIRSFQYP
jgi:hypothetical protein